jgi:putative nucleotidyltransferase with HDIG domain
MPEKTPNSAISVGQVELAVNRLDCLSTLPCIAAQYIPKITKSPFQPSIISDLIESDPVLTARFLSLISSHGMSMPDSKFTIGKMIDKLSANEVRDALFSMKVASTINNAEQTPDRKGLIVHSLAVACYAREIAELISTAMDSQSAYFAGLLHDLGKFALLDIMPRSFYRIIEQARAEKLSSLVIEQQQIGMGHTLIGKRLAEKWQFPDSISLSIWLHHSLTVKVLHEMPHAKTAAVVKIADSLARQTETGNSGSFDMPEPIEPLAGELGINPEQLQQIHQKARNEVNKKNDLLCLDVPDAFQKYLVTLQAAAVQSSRRDNELAEEIRKLQSTSGHFNFIKDFLLSIKTGVSAIEIAENFAVRWQKFFQTGKVCLYLLPPAGSQSVEAAVVESLSQSETLVLNVPAESPVMPTNITNNFVIINADDHIAWLLEQLEADFDTSHTRLAPLLFGTKAVGVIAFELHYPGDIELFEDKFRTSASIAGMVLAAALDKRKEQNFAECFVRLISSTVPEKTFMPGKIKTKDETEEFSPGYSLAALAELAAGAAHELNNPLAVISGRAQLLAESEQNQENKQILQQIQDNANEASEIIEDLMSFAEPPPPRPTLTKVSQVIDEALQLAGRKAKVEKINAKIEKADDVKSLFIDSAQIVSAVANIICNAVESYGDITGLVEITAQPAEFDDFVKLSIEDHGCGMSNETLKKATQPFFSAKPAGRKRGMGLAYAARLIQLNKGSLSIASELNKGTTVSIYLPYK